MWQWYALAAMACFATMQLIFKQVTRTGLSSPAMMIVVFAVGTVCYAVHLRLNRTALPADLPALVWLALAGVLAYIGNFYAVRAVASAPNPGYAAAIVALQGVVVTVAAMLLFGSELTATKLLGVLLCFAGLVVVVL